MSAERANRLQAIFDNINISKSNLIQQDKTAKGIANNLPHTEGFEIRMRKAFLHLQDAKQYEQTQ